MQESRQAIEEGNSYAMYNLADRLFKGDGVKKDEKEGKKLIRQAAELGNEEAQQFLKDLEG